jgi:hypothetical protein
MSNTSEKYKERTLADMIGTYKKKIKKSIG